MTDLEYGTIPVPRFSKGDAYDKWRYKFLLLLKLKGCEEVVNHQVRPNSSPISVVDWRKKDVKVCNFFAAAVDVDLIMDCATGYEMLQKLDDLYAKKSETKQVLIEKKIMALKFSEASPEDFFSKFDRLLKELSAAGGSVERKRKLGYLLLLLPESYNHIVDGLDQLPEDRRTVEYVMEKVLVRKQIAENKELGKTQYEKHDPQVFKTTAGLETRGRGNYYGGRRGNNSGRMFHGYCSRCNKYGHMRRDCHVKIDEAEFQNNQTNRREHFNRGRGYGNWRQGRGNCRRRGNQYTQQESPKYNEVQSNNLEAFITEANEVNSNEAKLENEKILWILDSGDTDHICTSDKYLINKVELETPVNVRVGDGRPLKSTKKGSIKTYFYAGDQYSEILINNVYYVPDMRRNLLSVGRITDEGKKLTYEGNYAEIYNKQGRLLAKAQKINRLYYVTSFQNPEMESNVTFSNDKEKWHRILGHTDFYNLNVMCKNQLLEGLPQDLGNEFMKCEFCLTCKMTNKKYGVNTRKRARYCCEIIHTDVKTMDTPGYNGEKYFVVFVDDFSNIAQVYPINRKSEVFTKFTSYVNYVENLTGNRVREVRCDNGGEYLNRDFYAFARNKGFRIRPCPAFNKELNGKAERFIRTVMDKERCLQKESGLSKSYWPEFVRCAAYLHNRILSSSTLIQKTPYEIFFGEKPTCKNLKLYGSDVFVRVPEEKRTTQSDKSKKGILVGYSDVGYRVLVDGKVNVVRNVDIVEDDTKLIMIESDKEENGKEMESDNDSGGEECELRRSTRVKKQPDWYQAHEIEVYAMDMCDESPKTYEEALNSKESDNWRVAIKEELDAMKRNKVWKICKRPKGVETIDSKWIFVKKNKEDGRVRYKGRIVARGFMQTGDFSNEETYPPVAKLSTI